MIGASKEGKVAGHADTIDSVVRAYKDGSVESTSYSGQPGSKTPGQDFLQYVDSKHPDAKAVVTGELRGPPGYKARALLNVREGSIESIMQRYQEGEFDEEIELYLAAIDKAETIRVPVRSGAGKGVRALKGRGGHPPEEQEEVGLESGTKYGRKAEGKPKGLGYDRSDDDAGEPEEGEQAEGDEEMDEAA